MLELDYKTSGAVKTQSGHTFRFYAEDGQGTYRVHGAYFNCGWVSGRWNTKGLHEGQDSLSLVPVKKKKKFSLMIQVFKDGSYKAIRPIDMGSYSHPNFAQKTIEVEVEEGEGL